jgi:phosphate transport system permease protein
LGNRRHRPRGEGHVYTLLMLCALLASASIGLIAFFVLLEGWPALTVIWESVWDPEMSRFGLLPLVSGSFAVTAGALVIAIPGGIGMALFLTEVAPRRVAQLFRPLLQALAAVPSVAYGFVGLTLLIPWIRRSFGGPGFSVLAGALVLGVMVLPTIAAVAEDALRALPHTYREGALALGATQGQVIWRLLLPAARRGLAAAVILGLGRAMGETMAVLMVTGNVGLSPTSVLAPVRTLTGNIALEMGYAAGMHRDALFATGAILLAAVLLLNSAARRVGE